MRFNEFFVGTSGNGSMFWRYQMTLGIAVIAAGLIVALVPQILIAVISGTLVLVGLSLVASAWRLRRSIRPTDPPFPPDTRPW